VLLDYDLGRQTGSDFLQEAKLIGFQGKVLIVTAGLSHVEGPELMRLGASGIFMKHSSAATLSQAIRQVMSGGVWFEQEYLRRMFDVPIAEKQDQPASSQQLGETGTPGPPLHLGRLNEQTDRRSSGYLGKLCKSNSSAVIRQSRCTYPKPIGPGCPRTIPGSTLARSMTLLVHCQPLYTWFTKEQLKVEI